MQKAANLVRGWVEAEVIGPDGEEFINLCARRRIPFWGVEFRDGTTLRLRTSAGRWREVKKLGEGGRWETRLVRRGGVPGLVWRLRYRWGLFLGLALALAAVGALSQFVLTVRVSGNIEVPTEAIMTQLRAHGVRPGAFGPGLDTRTVAHEVILALPKLSWVSVNLHGTVAEVLVREGSPPPDLVEEEKPAHIVAKYTGIITHMETTRGMAVVEEGDTVVAGDTLISSWVDFEEPPEATSDWGGILVRASGKVIARTWHTLEAAIPLEGSRKEYTGEEKTRWSLEILGHTVKFYGNGGIPFEKYDRITTYHTASLPGGQSLPLAIRREVYRAYETRETPIDRERGEVLLRRQLQERLDDLTAQGEVLRTDYKTEVRDGLLTVTLLAECRQEIGKIVED